VFFRTAKPDYITVAEVVKIEQQKGINATQLVELSANHCKEVELYANTSSVGDGISFPPILQEVINFVL
jgi:hypothetical protein